MSYFRSSCLFMCGIIFSCICQSVEDGPKNTTITKNSIVIQIETIEEDTILTVPLHCSSNCNPPCEINWFKDGTILFGETNEVFNMRRNRTMSGVYTCRATGEEGTETSKPVTVTVTYPHGSVRISPDKDTFFTKRGGTPKEDVVCTADCLPQCTYKWYYAFVPQRSGYLWTMGNTLFANRKFTYTYYSYFYCEATNDHGSSYSIWIKIDVKDGPENVTFTSLQAPIENRPFSLHCSANCLHGCDSYRWSNGSRRLNKSTAILTFDNLSRADNGKFTCSVEDYFGRSSRSYNLNVQYPPEDVRITPENDIFYSPRGGTPYVDVVCEADCLPPCSYTWYYASSRSSPWWDTYQFTTGNTLFAKRNFTHERYPYFHCVAENSLDSAKSKWITINTKDGPENVTVTTSQSPKENQPIDLVCSANCIHGCLSYQWSYMTGGKQTYENSANLTFHNLSRTDSGEYTCNVSDYFGRRSNSYIMNVQYTDLSPTSRRGRITDIREMELKNLELEHTKLEEEIKKLREERKVLELKQQYFNIRLKQIVKGTKK